jgi:hypothetical protein
MAIEFSCPSCQTLIRTPEGTEGKAARCPQCGSVVMVPGGGGSAGASPSLEPALPAGSRSPFAESRAPLSSLEPKRDTPAPLNPYATPANPFAHDPFQTVPSADLAQRAYWKLLWPAVGLIVFGLLGLAFMALVGFGFAMDPDIFFGNVDRDPAQRAGAIGFLVAYFTVGFVTRVLQLLGAIAMIRQRGYGLALAAGISALIPCEIYCCLPSFPLGVWALIMLNSAEVKAAFKR